MKKNAQVFLQHIRQSVDLIESYIKDISEDNFYTNFEKQDAVIKRLEVIGEAIKNLPDDFKQANPNIPWQDISDMRNKLIHEYFGVDLELVWSVVKNDLPTLKRHIITLI